MGFGTAVSRLGRCVQRVSLCTNTIATCRQICAQWLTENYGAVSLAVLEVYGVSTRVPGGSRQRRVGMWPRLLHCPAARQREMKSSPSQTTGTCPKWLVYDLHHSPSNILTRPASCCMSLLALAALSRRCRVWLAGASVLRNNRQL